MKGFLQRNFVTKHPGFCEILNPNTKKTDLKLNL